ncbi:MAG: hypothetical protein PHP74_03450, partial [Candidatus Gracilibacteria bacterium]|nr:hypothetical protein [Candidatus Gracilibacteria bacterium]
MIEDQKKIIFPSDPFRENTQYTLNINPGTVVRNHVENKQSEDEAKIEEKGERTLKGILKEATRQIIASLVILVIGFFALNWSAYYQIAKNKIDGYRGVLNQQDAVGMVKENDNEEEFKDVLSASADIEVQKNQIPDLNMEIVPIDTRLIIPRINQNIPIVGVSSKNLIEKNWNALEKDMQEALKDGVIHYPGTSYPGQKGNVVITGHSSYFPWDSGRFKDVFALLHQL